MFFRFLSPLVRKILMEKVSTDGEICQSTIGENMINTLPNDLLVEILMLLPIKDAVATMILSKRWFSVWAMMPELYYIDTNDGEDKSVWHFLDKSIKLHKAPVLDYIEVKLGPQCPVDEDVGKWITNVTCRKVNSLSFELKWSAEPIKLPHILYTCDTLVCLKLSHKILVDIVSPTSLPSLKWLCLNSVIYKDEDSLVGLLSSSPFLKFLCVIRDLEDNVKTFKLKLSSLEILVYANYINYDSEDVKRSLVIDSPALKTIIISRTSEDFFTIENTPCLDQALIRVMCDPGDTKFMFSSLTFFDICLKKAMVKLCTTTNFSQLVECRIQPSSFDWLEPVMVLLQNSPKLKLLLVDQSFDYGDGVSWNCPRSVPKCLSTQLEIFEWKEYQGKGNEKELVRYIFANSRCLKRVAISIQATCNLQDRQKIVNELDSMSRISQSSQLAYTPIIIKDDYENRLRQFIEKVNDTFINNQKDSSENV